MRLFLFLEPEGRTCYEEQEMYDGLEAALKEREAAKATPALTTAR